MAHDRLTFPRPFQKIFIILTIFIGLLVNVFLVGVVTRFKSNAANVEIYFSPTSGSIPPNLAIQLIIDPKGNNISFADVYLHFDPSLIRLNSEISTSGSPLTGEINVTSMNEANTIGEIQIGRFRQPGMPSATTTFTLGTLFFTAVTGSSVEATEITIVDEPTQLVSSMGPELNFTTRSASINAGSGMPKGIIKPIAKLLQGNCPSADYIDTAIGCIPYSDSQAMASFFLSWGLGIGGGIAFILIVYAAFKITSSQGDPHRVQAGKELLTAAISGLILLIFAAYILRFFGVDVLGIL